MEVGVKFSGREAGRPPMAIRRLTMVEPNTAVKQYLTSKRKAFLVLSYRVFVCVCSTCSLVYIFPREPPWTGCTARSLRPARDRTEERGPDPCPSTDKPASQDRLWSKQRECQTNSWTWIQLGLTPREIQGKRRLAEERQTAITQP